MAKQTIKTVFQVRRDSTANWELYKDIVPAAGEPCYDLELKTLRIGDGITEYGKLPVIGSVENTEDLQAAIEQLQAQVGDTNIVEIQENFTSLTAQMDTVNVEMTEMQQTLGAKADADTVYTKEEVYTKAEVDDMYATLDPEQTYVFSGGDI